MCLAQTHAHIDIKIPVPVKKNVHLKVYLCALCVFLRVQTPTNKEKPNHNSN